MFPPLLLQMPPCWQQESSMPSIPALVEGTNKAFGHWLVSGEGISSLLPAAPGPAAGCLLPSAAAGCSEMHLTACDLAGCNYCRPHGGPADDNVGPGLPGV